MLHRPWTAALPAPLLITRVLPIVGVVLLLLCLLAAGVSAQAPGDEEEPAGPSLQPVVATVQQAVPLTLTFSLPSPTGAITVEVPVSLTLAIRIGIGDSVTATLNVTPTVGSLTSTAGSTVVVGAPTADETTEEVEEEATPAASPSPTPTAQPTRPVGATLTPTPAGGAGDETGDEGAEEAPTATPTPEPTPTEEAAEVVAPSCPDPRAVITAPGVNQTVSGMVDVIGSATHENFQYYKLEYAPGAGVSPDANFAYLTDARVPVSNGVLASFDSTMLDNGDYTLKLTVVDNTGNFPPPCTVSIRIFN
ncbi:MAG TPA: hypothetical protein VNK95_04535 [Caldilineaceae bacterium]|nr:hypothetical protein [Caldilineaceae bacterium]